MRTQEQFCRASVAFTRSWHWLATWSCVGVLAQASNASAADDGKADEPVQLEPVVVSATRTEIAAEEAPASVTVIDRQEMEKHNPRTVDETLRYVTGVEVKRSKGIADATPRVQIRGLNGQDRTLFLIDGLALNDGYNGDVPSTQLSMDNIERIEIIRGSGSALYGGHAMGGVVNIITRRPSVPETSLRAGYGSDNTNRIFLSYGGPVRPSVGLRLAFEHESTDGYANTPVSRSPSAGTGTLRGGYAIINTSGEDQWVVGDKGTNWAKRNNVNLQAYWDPAKTTRFKLNLQLGRQEYGYGPPHSYLTDENGAVAMSGAVDLGAGQRAAVTPASYIYYTGIGNSTFGSGALSWEQHFGDVALTTKVGYQSTAKWYTSNSATGDADYSTAPGSLSDGTTQSWLADVQVVAPVGKRHLLTGGTSFKYNFFHQYTHALSQYREPDSKTSRTDQTRGRDHVEAIYLQDEWRPWDVLAIYLGTRVDIWTELDGRSGNVGKVAEFDTHSAWTLSPKLATVYNPWKETTVRASVGRAFRPPSIYELYRTWQSGTLVYHSNPQLGPETLWSGEFGAEQRFWDGRVRFGATAFYTELYDVIESYTIDKDRYQDNVSRASVKGVEWEVDVRPFRPLRLCTNTALVDTRVKKNERNPTAEGKHLPNTAHQLANLGVEYAFPWFRAGFAGHYRGRLYTSELNDDIPGVYGAYSDCWLWNGKLTAIPRREFEVSLSVNNIFDTRYFDYYIGRGRTYFVEAVARL